MKQLQNYVGLNVFIYNAFCYSITYSLEIHEPKSEEVCVVVSQTGTHLFTFQL